ncbi:glycerate kinase [Mesonia mobilis]|uniref:glycerate kinase n=1 Tax=Mesonia mobilis TaxID=369791 RepID=UPI001239C80A|nr:glycerate kinase [Mesonia mobilis]|tara:strand:- start:138 stop:1283 length:1146 start_codon:yes stop_codon:yes gene_type:complete
MKFVIAPDKFKGSLTGFEFCTAVEKGLVKVFPQAEIIHLPLADGGDGTLEIAQHHLKGTKIEILVNDPFFRKIKASYVFSKDTEIAYIEMAEASGLKRIAENEKNVMRATSFGTGELILHAIEKGAKHILLGIGGSATNDCGMGMAAALGYSFLDANGQKLKPIGANLTQVETIDVSNVQEKLKNIKFSIACDVQNPLYGNEGAAFVYAEQKGASIENILQLDRGLQHFANILQQQFGVDCQQINGAGAAGGVGAGSIVFLNGNLVSGIELIKNISNFDEVIQDADWLITGEGKLDEQTFYGKTIQGVINSAKQNNIPVAAFCGAISLNIEQQQKMGLTYCTSILKTISSLQEAINYSEENLIHSVYNFANLIKFRKKLSD